MQLDPAQRAFIEQQPSAAMITLRADGSSHAVRVGVGLIDGRIWSSGTQGRKRTRQLRRDPRATLFIFDGGWRWLTLECRASILDGPDAVDMNVRFFKQMQPLSASGRMNWFGREVDEAGFRQIMADERRLIYEFEPLRAYGMYEVSG